MLYYNNMSGEYDKSKEVGKEIGKVFSKLINVTTTYCDIVVNTFTSAYNGFTEETKKSTKSKQRSTDDINTCVENELENVENENDAEL